TGSGSAYRSGSWLGAVRGARWRRARREGAGTPGRPRPVSVDVALEQVAVGVDPPVAQERPDPAHVFAALQVDLAHQHRGVLAGLGQEFTLRPQDVAVAPELDAGGAQRRGLVADAVARQHRYAVGHGVTAVAQDPGVALAVLL